MQHNTIGTLSLFTPAGQRKYLTTDERRRFLEAASHHLRPEVRTFCLVLAHVGCRVSEALSLTGMSFDIANGFVAVRCLKKRNRAVVVREVPLPPDLIETLLGAHGDQMQSPDRLWLWSRSRAWQIVKAVMEQAHIPTGPHATPKGLRHGYGLHAVRCGIPVNLVQRWLGHASMATTAIYLQAMGREERDIAARMWQ